MDNSSTWIGPIAACVVGLVSKIVWDWLNRNNSNEQKQQGPSPIVGDWGTITYLKTHLPQLLERMDKMTAGLKEIDEKTHKINKDNSVTDDKTGRKLIYVPTSLMDDMGALKLHSLESNTILKQINETLTRFFQLNSEALARQNDILSDLRLSKNT
jgi:hypothetical protein